MAMPWEIWLPIISGVITTFATIAIAAFTGTLWRATTKQASLTRESINLAREEFVSTHRPKLRVRHIVLTHPVPPSLKPLELIEAGQPIVGHLDIWNVGETPAHIVESHCKVFWTKDAGLPMTSPYESERANNFAGSQVLEPGQSASCDFRSAVTMDDDAERYRRLTQGFHIYVMGWIRYADGRKITRQTTFCRLYNVANGERHPRFHVVDDPDYEHED